MAGPSRFIQNFAVFCMACAITVAACSPSRVEAAEDMHYACELDDGGIVPLVLHDNLSGWVKLQEHAQPITWSTFGEGKGMLVSWSTSVGIGIVIFNMHTGTGEISLLGELEIEYPCTCKQSTPL